MTTGAGVLVRELERFGVRHLFGMPGSHSTAIYDAFSQSPTISTYLIRNEQAGAFAADGYARVTGRPGIVCTTAGPGATNALTGVAECWADSVPILLLSGQVNADRMHLECGAYHEIDLESIFRAVTKWCGTPASVEEIPAMVARAFGAMANGRPRPAALFLPQDVARLEGDPGPIPSVPRPGPLGLSGREIMDAAEILSRAERPIILAGGGAVWSDAAGEIVALAQKLGAPIVTSLNGKGIVDEQHPLSLGHARSARAKVALPHADAMLAIGCRFTEVMTEWRRMPVPEALVQIDIDADQIGMNHPVAVGIVADAKTALGALVAAIPDNSGGGWSSIMPEAREARPAKPEWLIEVLRSKLPPDVPVFADACEMGYRLHTDWISPGPRLLFYPSNYITLGWGFPAAIGAAVALEGTPVVSVSGDGGFLMTAQELATASRYRLRVIAVVHNDSTYGAIKNIQRRVHEDRFLDVELNNPDFLQLADAFGVPACRVEHSGDLATALDEALGRDGPSVIEVPDRWRLLRT